MVAEGREGDLGLWSSMEMDTWGTGKLGCIWPGDIDIPRQGLELVVAGRPGGQTCRVLMGARRALGSSGERRCPQGRKEEDQGSALWCRKASRTPRMCRH